LNLVLVGVRAATGAEAQGAAIIQTPDNMQRLYRVGDSIVAGVTLAAVDSDRVVILRDGVRESVVFTDRASVIGGGEASAGLAAAAVETAVAPAPEPAGAAPVNARALLDDITPQFRPEGGVVVTPRGGAAFAAAGLEPSDLLRSVNGVSLDSPETWSAALAGVGPGSRVTIEAERAGRPVVIEFTLE
jgi:general secretion pathway protein C